jgi:zinc transport system permease protein
MIAYRIGSNWRGALWVATTISLLAYTAAFALAFAVDQPFGPVLVLVLAGLAAFAYLAPVMLWRRAPATL